MKDLTPTIPVPIITWTGNCGTESNKSEKWPAQLLFKNRLTPCLFVPEKHDGQG